MAKTTKQTFNFPDKYNRNFSLAFKKEKVNEIIKGKITIKQLCDIYDISKTSVYRWLHKFGNIETNTKTVVQLESEQNKTVRLLQKMSELERVLGQKEMQISFLNKVISLASEEVGFDLKKKFESKQ